MGNNIKSWYKIKTIWIAVIQAIGGVAVAFITTFDGLGYLMVFKSVLDVLLRSITYEEVSK